ncbi:MAG: hypothetical protein ACO1OC_03490 [Tuberibacillus sp.]
MTLIDHLFKEYGLRLEPVILYGRQWLSDGNHIFSLQYKDAFSHPDVKELQFYSSQMINQGDRRIAAIVPTQKGDDVTKFEKQDYVLLAMPPIDNPEHPDAITLARFHEKGRQILTQMPSHHYLLHGWRHFWAKRVDDLSEKWNEFEQKRERSPFEDLYLQVFPYFSGRAENAIQYVTDLFIDQAISDSPVICHYRFHPHVWGPETLFAKTPEAWVVDHPGRDLAEWMRVAIIHEDRPMSAIHQFMDDYLGETELSAGGIGLVFARLLFPLTFIEDAEHYFDGFLDATVAWKRLNLQLDRADEEERLLASFGKRYMKSLPRVDWLAHKRKTSAKDTAFP